MLIESDGQHLIRCDRCGRADTVVGDDAIERFADAECWGWEIGNDGHPDLCLDCQDELKAQQALKRKAGTSND